MKPTKHDLYRLPLWRRATGAWRALPDFLILGAQKAGTTTLYDNLVKHPRVVPADIKEVHFFDSNWTRGVNWYRGHFALKSALQREAGTITGEGSPYYLFHPLVPARVRQVVPAARLLVVLRDPVERAYSHYQHEKRKGREPLSFEEAVAAEPERLAGEMERVGADAGYASFALQHYSYVERGKYAEQLRRWFAMFPREQLLVLTSDELNREFNATMERAFEFLGVPPHSVERPKRSNVGSYEKMSEQTRAELSDLFRPHNAELEEMLGRKLGWG
jgi:hypothetical protein